MKASSTASHEVPLGAKTRDLTAMGVPSSGRKTDRASPLLERTATATAPSATRGAPSTVHGELESVTAVDQRVWPEKASMQYRRATPWAPPETT